MNDKIENFGVLVKAEGSVDSGNMFMMDKGLGLIELVNSTAGSVNLIGDLYLTNDTEIAQVVCEKNEIQIVKTGGESKDKEIIILCGIPD
jgi:prephenate dehydratase